MQCTVYSYNVALVDYLGSYTYEDVGLRLTAE